MRNCRDIAACAEHCDFKSHCPRITNRGKRKTVKLDLDIYVRKLNAFNIFKGLKSGQHNLYKVIQNGVIAIVRENK